MVTATILDRDAAAMSDADLYEYDFPAWCERQVDHLRTLADAPATIRSADWSNLIEEVTSLGREQRRRVESLLVQALLHLLKLRAQPGSADGPHWTVETRGFLEEAQSEFTPSMRRSIDVDALYRSAIYRLTGRRSKKTSPVLLDDLLTPFPDVAALLAKLPPP